MRKTILGYGNLRCVRQDKQVAITNKEKKEIMDKAHSVIYNLKLGWQSSLESLQGNNSRKGLGRTRDAEFR